MAFKEGTEIEHVHAFRLLVHQAKKLDEMIDGNQLTPQEALEELQAHIKAFPPAAKKGKKDA